MPLLPPSGMQQHTTLNEDHPAATEDNPTLNEDHPAATEDNPTLNEDHPAGTEDCAAEADVLPAVQSHAPAQDQQDDSSSGSDSINGILSSTLNETSALTIDPCKFTVYANSYYCI